jgi:poly-gamma-glutamate synthesis protein (capsule biosynthesis protein)
MFSVGCADGGVPTWWAAAPGRPGVHALADLDDAAVQQLGRAIAPWRTPGTVIVLSLHWGPNWGFSVDPEHRRFAHRMIDEAGVDVVHGHSSHHVKGIEVHHGRPILYGCGDLLTDYEGIRGHEAYRGELGLLYLVTLDHAGALAQLELAPVRVRRFRIERAGADDTRWLVTTLGRAGEALGTSVAFAEPHLVLRW